jgi:hypothetical protein
MDWVTDCAGDLTDIFNHLKETGKMPVPQDLNAFVARASCPFWVKKQAKCLSYQNLIQ